MIATADAEPARVQIVEVAPRDGLQNDPTDLSTTAKAELVVRAAAVGVRRVEVTSFVSPKMVPKMADAESLMAALRSHPELHSVSFAGLVVNARGVARAAAAGVHEVNSVIVATDAFSQANQGTSTAESLASLGELVEAAHTAGLHACVTIGAAFGCPFEGEVSIDRLSWVAGSVAATGADELSLADTIGVAVPSDVTARFAAVRSAAGSTMPLRAHFHNTRNTGIANAVAAAEAGVGALDASLGGIGGCPFAPSATGNIATEDLVYVMERSGIDTGIDLERLVEDATWLEEQLGHCVPAMLGRAGLFPRE